MFYVNDINSYSFVYFCNENCAYIDDTDIIRLLDLSLEKYINLAAQFNGINSKGIIFYSYSDAQRFTNYLNDKYLLILKLAGKL